MKKIRRISLLPAQFTTLVICAAMQPAAANPLAECRAEADYYGISPELHAEYIDGCLASRGEEDLAPEIGVEDYTPPPEMDDNTEVEAAVNDAEAAINENEAQ